ARLLKPLESQPGDLIATLTAYLDAGGSVAETAAVLGVHRNTVTARLRRIEELLTADLANPDDRLALHLACRVTQGRQSGGWGGRAVLPYGTAGGGAALRPGAAATAAARRAASGGRGPSPAGP